MSAYESDIRVTDWPSTALINAALTNTSVPGTNRPSSNKPCHGGNLEHFMRERNLAKPMLDLSSAVNPQPYADLNQLESSWAQLPYLSEGLRKSVARYYESEHFVLVPGSQWAIEALPNVIRSQLQSTASITVCLPNSGYSEHRFHWSKQTLPSVQIDDFLFTPSDEQLRDSDVCVVINPHNPLGHVLDFDVMRAMAYQATKSHTWLIVDEAFVDFYADVSLAQLVNQPGYENLIVLRSFGKFSGLPGARLGAIGAHEKVLAEIRACLPLWSISSAALSVFDRVVNDTEWLADAKASVAASSLQLHSLLASVFPSVTSRALLFSSVRCDNANAWFETLVQEGVYVRLLDDNTGLRFSLPRDEHQFTYLNNALARASTLMGSPS